MAEIRSQVFTLHSRESSSSFVPLIKNMCFQNETSNAVVIYDFVQVDSELIEQDFECKLKSDYFSCIGEFGIYS